MNDQPLFTMFFPRWKEPLWPVTAWLAKLAWENQAVRKLSWLTDSEHFSADFYES